MEMDIFFSDALGLSMAMYSQLCATSLGCSPFHSFRCATLYIGRCPEI